MDFTYAKYSTLLSALKNAGYAFQTFEEFMEFPAQKVIILRHDVDKRPDNSLLFAKIESSMNIKASYHFRIGGTAENPEQLINIRGLGHEIAYHYEDLSRIVKRKRVDETVLKNAFEAFCRNLNFFRKYYPVKVASMHGDPTSSTDNRNLWKTFDYKSEGILCEPYYDIDYSAVLYITDTGRTWNNKKINMRDKPEPGIGITSGATLSDSFVFNSTSDIICAAKMGLLPSVVIINTHPQRWNDNLFFWLAELVMQKMKNCVKYFIILYRNFKRTIKS